MPPAQELKQDMDYPHKVKPRMMFYLALLTVFIVLGLYAFANYEQAILGWMQDNQEWMIEGISAHPVLGPLVYVIVFTLVIGFFIPGGIVLLLLAGALFPFWEANIYANLGNMLGATIGFYLSRYLLREEVQGYYGKRLEAVNEGIRESGWVYLLILRIAPVLPSPLINLGMGLTPIKTSVYMLVTLLGRIPMTMIYVNLGMRLSEIDRLSDLLSAEILISLFLVGALMLGGHLVLQRRRAKANGD